jgi:hypothetical protein
MAKLTTATVKDALSKLTWDDLPYLVAQDEATCYTDVPASYYVRRKKVTDGLGRVVRSFRNKYDDFPAVVVSDAADENILGIYCDAYEYFLDPEDDVALKDATQPWRPPTSPSDFVFIFSHRHAAIGPMVTITPQLMFDNEDRVADQSWANGFLTVCDDGMNVRPIHGLYEESESLYSWGSDDHLSPFWQNRGVKLLMTEGEVREFLLGLGLAERKPTW